MTFLGLDVGGTNCRYEWWPSGAMRGGDARAVQPAVQGIEASVNGLAEALATAMRECVPEAVVCALAGVGDTSTSEAIAAGLRFCGVTTPVAIVGDVLAAAAAALADGPGVLVWAGTGSFAVARGADGRLHRVGGRGYLLGDQGSGYDLVRHAAAAALAAVDDLGHQTALVEALTRAFDAPSPQRLGAVMQRLEPGAVAAKLPVVLDVAAAGDPVAMAVLHGGVTALVDLAKAAARRAELALLDLPVAIGGGVLLAAPMLADAFTRRMVASGAERARAIDARAAARGAAWLAHGWHLGLQPQREWVERVAL